MNQSEIHLLFTADKNYIPYIAVVLKSLSVNDPFRNYHIHLIHNDEDAECKAYCQQLGYACNTYQIDEKFLENTPVNKYYSAVMYYRLFAPEILPESVKKVIYLDPDILVLNPLHPLWETEMENCLFLAASHTEKHEVIDNINRIRLNTSAPYFNTGIMVMNLEEIRRTYEKEKIYQFIEKNASFLLLPDQDVFNALYGHVTKPVPDIIWNYDARKYSHYYRKSSRTADEKWLMQNTVIMHFCGKSKPWKTQYPYRFGNLYLHYMHLAGIL